MKKLASVLLTLVLASGAVTSLTQAQMMRGVTITDDHTAREEASGKAIWEEFQAKRVTCDKLTDDNFEALGEYFMGTMMGSSHSAMNAMMTQMLGEDGEARMHIVMGRRLSGCDVTAAFPAGSTGFMPILPMMWGGCTSPFAFNSTNNNMMNFGYKLSFLGWIFMLLWWALVIVLLVAAAKWIANPPGGSQSKSALDILKERYSKGEVDKKEFEEKKKDIT